MGVLKHGLNTADPLGQGGQYETCSLKILAYILRNLQLISDLMGWGFYSSSHLLRFEGVWWLGEGGEVRLNGKAARFHFWLQAPSMLMPGATKQGFVCVPQRPVPVGEKLQALPETWPWLQVVGPRLPQATPHWVPQRSWAPRGMHFSLGAGATSRQQRVSQYWPQAAATHVAGGCPRTHIQGRSSTPSAPNIISSCEKKPVYVECTLDVQEEFLRE